MVRGCADCGGGSGNRNGIGIPRQQSSVTSGATERPNHQKNVSTIYSSETIRFGLSKDSNTLKKVLQGCKPIEYQRISMDFNSIKKFEKKSNCEWNEWEIYINKSYIILQQMRPQWERGREVLRYTGYCKVVERGKGTLIKEKGTIIGVEAPENYWMYYKRKDL